MSISTWFRTSTKTAWKAKAACPFHQHLPWIAERKPSQADLAAMHRVCSDCPVFANCVNYALDGTDEPAPLGGFYAGVWLPWPHPNESREHRAIRRQSLATLRAIRASA